MAFTMFGFSVNSEAAKKTVLVNVRNSTGNAYGDQVAAHFRAELTNILVHGGVYSVVERNQLDGVIREVGLQRTGLMDKKTTIRTGKMKGADISVMAEVVLAAFGDHMDAIDGLVSIASRNEYAVNGKKAKVKINYRIVDNETGDILGSEMLTGSKSTAVATTSAARGVSKYGKNFLLLAGATDEIVEKVAAQLTKAEPLVGAVAQIDGKIVYINLGTKDGVHIGDYYRAFLNGKPIIDPVTNNILGVKEEFVATLKIVDVQREYAVAEIKKQKGVLSPGCRVKKITKEER